MKAVQINRYGGSEAVEIKKDAPKPAISQGKLLIEAYAAGVNPVDLAIREGHMKQMAPLNFPATLGGDFSGVVAEAGPGVSGFKKGDEVYGYASTLGGGSGSFAEYILVDAKKAAKKPKSMDILAAGALPLVGISAFDVLTSKIKLAKGQKILIQGGAGGIGSIAIQIAKHLGAHVAATAGPEAKEYVKNLGADESIDYKSQQFDALLKGYDAVFDTVGGETYARSFKVLKRGGIIVSMLAKPDEELMKKHGVRAESEYSAPAINTENLSKLAELADKIKLKVNIDKTFPLDKAGEAIDYIHTGHPKGKVVLQIKAK